MSGFFSRFTRWHLLNVGLPGIAAALTFLFAYITTKSRDVDEVLVKAYASGDNLVVASILFVVLYYEAEELGRHAHLRWVYEASRMAFLALCLVFTSLFGAFKFYSLTLQPDGDLSYAGAAISIAALFAACVSATVVKACLILFVPPQEQQTNAA